MANDIAHDPVDDIGRCNFIEHLAWDDVARRTAGGAAAILPIGAAAKQHGFHLPMNTDRIQAEWFAGQLAQRFDALVWPTVTYGYYPAFTEYAGSSSLLASTFEATVQEIAADILRQGCRVVIVLNTGISTLAPVERAVARLDGDRALHLRIYAGPRFLRATQQLAQQGHGSHADELETSLMLALAPQRVAMARAEASPAIEQEVPGPLTPSNPASPNYSRSGSYGDPTLATPHKGEILRAAIIDDLNEEVAAFVAERSTAKKRAPSIQIASR